VRLTQLNSFPTAQTLSVNAPEAIREIWINRMPGFRLLEKQGALFWSLLGKVRFSKVLADEFARSMEILINFRLIVSG